ncbi:MAG: hypothetical protein COU33_04880 [Candidatus Magasanikbacteria bacterium CG10_big_fil_rev_8_21_14_0_10_43_6]|uniref:EamA domain-containing protein n=1 Tax=Candidatus Magasanikbacteria bacterium CG10_big_fil_rev_8_21_14_0_10_43_6 TaxID=1974650 RepID=A0A2M6VZZ5_9BACT|nr:MAG: hypothetical protein COU33_04880 [Candidatus Magasanikbacteria bacterium CG10_big_fil_rev_8_21_14_0_10_43_6]
MTQERTGVLFGLAAAAGWGLFPILVQRGTQTIPPVTFAALSTLVSVATFVCYSTVRASWNELRDRRVYFPILMIALCIIVIPYTLFFVGASITSGVNAAILLLSEIIFSLIFTHFIGEHTTTTKLIGGGGVFLGAACILYNGSLSFHLGDILILCSTITYPLGNFYSKKALHLVSPDTILFLRASIGAIFLLLFARLVEPGVAMFQTFLAAWPVIVANGLLVLGLTKIFAYQSLKRLDISKFISIGATATFFSLIILILFFKEPMSVYQWIGIVFMTIGVYYSIKRKSVNATDTKYAHTHL